MIARDCYYARLFIVCGYILSSGVQVLLAVWDQYLRNNSNPPHDVHFLAQQLSTSFLLSLAFIYYR